MSKFVCTYDHDTREGTTRFPKSRPPTNGATSCVLKLDIPTALKLSRTSPEFPKTPQHFFTSLTHTRIFTRCVAMRKAGATRIKEYDGIETCDGVEPSWKFSRIGAADAY